MLKKYKPNGEIEFRPVYFNSTAKIVITHKFSLENTFQEILHWIDNCINEESGWTVELIESQYINISTYRLLSVGSCKKLPAELRIPEKGLINIQNNDQTCFCCCLVSHINPLKIHPERITWKDKKLANDLNYDRIEFPVTGKDFSKTEKESNICINVFCYQNNLVFPINVSDQESEKTLCCLYLMKTSYIMCKSMILTDLCFTKQRIKTKNTFIRIVYSALIVKMC